MKPKPVTETWERLPVPSALLRAAKQSEAGGAPACPATPARAERSEAGGGVAAGRQAGLVSNDGYRFDVVYHFYSSSHHHRLRVKVPLGAADPTVQSLTGLWRAADWFEREVWDMFGIRFGGHPDLRRLLMYEEFQGHPLRKDYPINRRQPLIGPKN
jgi:NADH:ubiquinone oxidoreductase subunit C